MNLADKHIAEAILLRRHKEDVDAQLAEFIVRRKRTVKKLAEESLTYGPLLANGNYYSHGFDKFTGRAYECCPTCGQRIR